MKRPGSASSSICSGLRQTSQRAGFRRMNRALALSCQHHQTLRARSRRRESSAGTSAMDMMDRRKGVAERLAESTRSTALCEASGCTRSPAFLRAVWKA